MINKLLIANRGEIAVRIIRTCKTIGIATVAIYSEADKEALHVKLADEAYCIGPANPELSYLNVDSILTLAKMTECDAIHPGYGFLSENPDFAEKVEQVGCIFVGPNHKAIRLLGQKSAAREIMKNAGIPVMPGSDSCIKSPEEGAEIAKAIGYPVLIKATSGGGGKGMRLVEKPEDFVNLCQMAQAESAAAFGDDRVYVEKYMKNPRHIEVQIAADQYGGVFALGVRECSIQRRHQKLLEESSSVALTPELRKKIAETALKVVRTINNGKDGIIYHNLGTVEFLLDEDGHFFFMEMNTRLQVEHPVTEMTCGQDLVALQICDAMKEPLDLDPDIEIIEPNGWAIECRINAEDPTTSFIPSPGKIEKYIAPGGLNVRIDTAVYDGYLIPSCYDTMIAKLITWGRNRDEAIFRMSAALDEYEIKGVANTISFHKFIMNNTEFLRGNFSTAFVDKYYDEFLTKIRMTEKKD